MRKHKSAFISIIVILFSTVVSLIYIFIPVNVKYDTNFKYLYDDYLIVAEYLSEHEYPYIVIHSPDKSIELMFRYYEKIESKKVNSSIKRLFVNGCNSIEKRGNTIEFLWQTRLNGSNLGIAYSANLSNEPVLDHVTKIEPLYKDGWYYYETQYYE